MKWEKKKDSWWGLAAGHLLTWSVLQSCAILVFSFFFQSDPVGAWNFGSDGSLIHGVGVLYHRAASLELKRFGPRGPSVYSFPGRISLAIFAIT